MSTKISELPSLVGAIPATNDVPIVSSGVTYKTTLGTAAAAATTDFINQTDLDDATVGFYSGKGDLQVGSAAGATILLSVGANNQIIVADSSTSSGMKWENPNYITLNGSSTVTTNSALSTSVIKLNGTWITGGTATTNKPHILIEPTGTTSTAWNTNGTGLGVNADSGFTGNLLDLQLGGTSKCRINYAGQINLDSSTGMIGSSAGTVMKLNFSNGIQLGNQTGIGITWSNNINPSTSVDAGIFRDDIGALGQRYSTTAQAYSVYGTYTSATNYERVKICYNSSATAFQIGTEKGSGGGTARNLQFVTDGTSKWEIGSSTDVYGSNGSLLPIADNTVDLGNNGKRIRNLRVGTSLACPYFTTYSALGSFKFTDGSGADFGKFQLGGTTASFPAIKRNGAGIDLCVADDSAYTFVSASAFIQTSNSINAQTGTTYTLLSSDNGKIVKLTNASAITVTVPAGLAIGFSCQIVQGGAGDVTIAASGTTVNSYGSLLTIAGQYASASLFSDTTNTFILAGNLK